ncbi:MAG: phosphatase PAP2 family protein [Devosia sp.]
MAQITKIGESDWILFPSLALLGLLFAAFLAARRRLVKLVLLEQAWLFLFVFAGVGLPSLISSLFKGLFGRGRPMDLDDPSPFGFHPNWLTWTDQSFPSGHATTAFALATVLSFLSPRWRVPVFMVAALVGVSRVVLGMHYPSDVLGGAALGTLGTYAVRRAFAQRRMLFENKPEGEIALRPLGALRRYLSLRRRGSARVPRQGPT